MKLTSKLQLLGLNQKEAKIYLASLELGEATIQEIASQARLKRPSLYHVIKDLIRRELMYSVVRERKRKFVAADPSELEKIVRRHDEVLKEAIPELKAFTGTAALTKPKMRLYEGLDGVKVVYQDILETKKSVKAFSGVKMGYQALGSFANEYIKERIKNNIPIKLIAPNDFWGREHQKKDKESKRETRLISKDKFPFEMEASIYGNKVNFVGFKKGRLIGVIIENPEIARTMESIFDFAWECAEKSKSLSPRRRGAKNKE